METAKRILAIETSGRYGSLAILSGETDASHLVSQIALGGGERTAQTLAPAMQRLLKEANWAPSAVELVAVAVGPGSFTGLRIGVTTAKAFAYAVGAEVVGINTLDALALQAPASKTPLWAILDAQRQELFAARFTRDDAGQPQCNRETSIISQDAWLALLQPGDRVTGPALSRLSARLPTGIITVPQNFWQPMAAAVGRVAWEAYQAGNRGDLWQLEPQYYRASAAEEKRPA